MSGGECEYCGSTDEVDNDVCDSCWYGMRLDPDGFKEQMKKLGVSLESGHHGWHELDDGKVIHVNSNPFLPGPVKLVRKP